MKSLLLTSAAALAFCVAGNSAFAGQLDQDGQERFAYEGTQYASNYYTPTNGYGYTPVNYQPVNYRPGVVTPINYNAPISQPLPFNRNTNYGYPQYNPLPAQNCANCGVTHPANNCPTCTNQFTNYSPVYQPQRLPVTNCANVNGRVICPTSANTSIRSRTPFTLGGFGGQF